MTTHVIEQPATLTPEERDNRAIARALLTWALDELARNPHAGDDDVELDARPLQQKAG